MNNSADARLPIDANATRFWWVRHAPVRLIDKVMYGSLDLDCDISDKALFKAVAARLPRDAVWVTSPLKRTQQTADALIAAGASAAEWLQDPAIAELNFGTHNGRMQAEMIAERTDKFIGFFPISPFETAPEGESFEILSERVANFVNRVHHEYAGRDIVCVAHRGTILAALKQALNLPLSHSVSFRIDNVSVSQLSRFPNRPAGGPEFKLAEVGWTP